MREVSCRALDPILVAAKRRGLVDAQLFASVSLPREHLYDRHERISWEQYCRIVENTQAVLDDDDFIAIGDSVIRSPLLRPIFIIARLLFSTRDFYAWTNSPRGPGSQLFSCVRAEQEEVGPGHLRVRLIIQGERPVCRPFLLISIGSLRSMPVALGSHQADVEFSELGDGALYEVRYQESVSALTYVRKAVTWPFTVRAAGRELKDAHETLTLRYAELERTRAELALAHDELEARVVQRTAELEAARHDLELSLEREREAQRAKDRIFANLNHDIRTPLASIVLATERMAAHAPPGDLSLGSIRHAAQELLQLFDELLVLAALDGGRGVAPVPVAIGPLLARQEAMWRPAFVDAGVELFTDIEDDVCAVDERALARVVGNLLGNALKYTPAGGQVRLTCRPDPADPGRTRLVVEDNGVGLTPGAEARIFGRFEKDREPVRHHGRGIGIGLALVKELVEAMGGEVHARSRAFTDDDGRRGTTFEVALRRADGQAREGGSPAISLPEVLPRLPRARAGGPLAPSRAEGLGDDRPLILIAEDDPSLNEQLAVLLLDRYRVLRAHDGDEALALAEAHLPHLLLSDVAMPRMDGFELCARFRAIGGLEGAGVILISAHGLAEQKLTGFLSGATDYVVKPVHPAELLARVQSCLDRADAFLRLHQAEQLSSMSTLVAGLAHELRNPANALINALPVLQQRLEDRGDLDPTSARLVSAMQTAGQQLGDTVRHLLGHASSRSFAAGLPDDAPSPGPALLKRRPHDVAEVVHRAVELVEAAGVRARIEADVPSGLRVSVAAPLLVQVLTNLIENGARAAGPEGTVRIAAAVVGECVQIQVRDSGPGVPTALLQRIFDPFFTTHPDAGGTGLGLFTARRLTQMHGGTLRAMPSPEPGGCFLVELPQASTASSVDTAELDDAERDGAERDDAEAHP